jgi:hypothetical protein
MFKRRLQSWTGSILKAIHSQSLLSPFLFNRIIISFLHLCLVPLFHNSSYFRMSELTLSQQTCRRPNLEEMHAVFSMCRQNQWNSVLNSVRSNPLIPVTSMIMDNHISTTILHQAITSKGDTKIRARVIREILDMTPQAARIKNGYGSLPLHVIAQRNTKMDSTTKELLINKLAQSYKGALVEEGGVGKRTPLHIIFTGTNSIPTIRE